MIPSLPFAISTLLKPSGLPIYTLSKCLASGLLYVHNFQSQVMGEEITPLKTFHRIKTHQYLVPAPALPIYTLLKSLPSGLL